VHDTSNQPRWGAASRPSCGGVFKHIFFGSAAPTATAAALVPQWRLIAVAGNKVGIGSCGRVGFLYST